MLVLKVIEMNEATITKLTSNIGPVAKALNAKGEKLKGKHFMSGSFITYTIRNMMDLKNLIFQLTPTECLMLGRFNINEGSIVTKDTYEKVLDKTTVRTRTKFHTNWNKKSILFFDYDFILGMAENMKAENFQELYEILIKILPEFANIEMLFKFSSSSNIYDVNTNTFIGTKIGIHIYFMVDNTDDNSIESFKELLRSRLWEHKLAYLTKDKQEKVQDVSLLDFAVFSREREIIENLPILPANLSVYTTGNEPKIFNEGAAAFDLNSINLDTEYKYHSELETQKQILQGEKYVSNISNINSCKSSNANGHDGLTASTTQRLNYIKILLQNARINYKQITPFFNGEIVSLLLQQFGYRVSSLKFKLRAHERTASASIRNENGLIFDFGADFSGTIIKLLIDYHQMYFKNALKYLYICLGADGIKLNEKIYFPLKDPSEVSKGIFTDRVIDLNIEVPKVQTYSKLNSLAKPKKSYDLKEIVAANNDLFRTSQTELESIFNSRFLDNHKAKLDELYPDLLGANSRITVGYSNDYRSLSLILSDENNELKTVAIRRNNNAKKIESWEKWKKYGSINYIPSKVSDEDATVYVAFGMMEIIVMELLGLSYIVFQSDSVAKKLDKNEQFLKIRNSINGKKLVLLLDSDDTCRETVKPLKRLLSSASEIAVIEFEKVLQRELEKGYDFVDYINEISCDTKITKENLLNILENKML